MRRYLVAILFMVVPLTAHARPLTLATWNLGWHMDLDTAKRWIEACNRTYTKDPVTGSWVPSGSSGAVEAWKLRVMEDIPEWDKKTFPVCDVYKDRDVVRVTLDAYRERQRQIATFIEKSAPADIFAFQEVNGTQAVAEVLPNAGADYNLCGFTEPGDYAVQRIVIAWKKTLGKQVSCKTEPSLHLKNNPESKRPRPGLSLDLDIDGQLLKILSVHLKSGCVSPFDGGNLEKGGNNCSVLQQQIDPLENWIEQEASGGAKIIVLGDFNRNVWHELRDQRPVRTDSSPASGERPAGALSIALLEEISDGVPPESALTVIEEECQTNEIGKLLCAQSEVRALDAAETALLGSRRYLGCRNPVGLDHILVGPGIQTKDRALHLSIRQFGGTIRGDKDGNGQKLAISDHCPMIATVAF